MRRLSSSAFAALAVTAMVLAATLAGADPIPPQDAPPAAAAVDAANDAAAAAAAPTATTAAADQAPSPVTVTVKAEPDEVTIGSRFRFTVTVTAPKGMQIVMAQPTERIGAFEILDFGDGPRDEDAGMTTVSRWYELAGFDVGHKEIESPPISYRAPGGDPKEAPPAHTIITVKSLLPESPDGADIRDVKPPEPLPIDWRPYYVVAAAVGALALIALLIWRFSRRGRPARVAPPIPADKIAYAELEKLRARRLIEVGAFKEYYSSLSDIVRTYVERRFGVRAPEMTTEEFLNVTARGGRLSHTHRGLLGNFLTESDLVKFARHVPTIADSERAYDAAKRFVDDTRESPGNGDVTTATLDTTALRPAAATDRDPTAPGAEDDDSRWAPPSSRAATPGRPTPGGHDAPR